MTQEPSEATAQIGKERVSVMLPTELVEKIRDVVWWTSGLTLTEFVEEALTNELYYAIGKRGAAFSPREGELRPGRKVAI